MIGNKYLLDITAFVGFIGINNVEVDIEGSCSVLRLRRETLRLEPTFSGHPACIGDVCTTSSDRYISAKPLIGCSAQLLTCDAQRHGVRHESWDVERLPQEK